MEGGSPGLSGGGCPGMPKPLPVGEIHHLPPSAAELSGSHGIPRRRSRGSSLRKDLEIEVETGLEQACARKECRGSTDSDWLTENKKEDLSESKAVPGPLGNLPMAGGYLLDHRHSHSACVGCMLLR